VKKPVWSEQVEAFVPMTEAELVVTFDHRVVDGGGAGLLLSRVAKLLQEPEKL
jgi:pyruvate/2-oxoglutarate dehydrogenase complex dihydrolipoamide acyltransferase (E2) component